MKNKSGTNVYERRTISCGGQVSVLQKIPETEKNPNFSRENVEKSEKIEKLGGFLVLKW